MGRYSVTEHPTLPPAVDYVTGTGVGPFIDTGRDIEGPGGRNLGRLYLSKSTVEEMARELGIIGTESHQATQAAYNQGMFDALQEGLSDDLVRVADTLSRWGAALGAAGRDDSHDEAAQR